MEINEKKLVEMKNIWKSYGEVQALRGVNFDVRYNEIRGLVGDNGAGKSTLIKTLIGIEDFSSGEIYFEGKKLQNINANLARKIGIETIHQRGNALEHLSVFRNIFINREIKKKLFWIDIKKMVEESKKALRNIRLQFDVFKNINELSGGERKGIAIARALYFKSKLIIMDEPTNDLSVTEAEKLIQISQKLKEEEISIIWISHNILDVYRVCDRIKLIDRGKDIADYEKEKITVDELREKIISAVRWRTSA
jgi:simple sugar transport system ATP-binding protein